jgi:hypothetical protein
MDRLEIIDQHCADPAGHLRRKRRKISLNHRVVCPLRPGRPNPLVPVDHNDRCEDTGQDYSEQAGKE